MWRCLYLIPRQRPLQHSPAHHPPHSEVNRPNVGAVDKWMQLPDEHPKWVEWIERSD